jgi:hypothetical protein
MGPSTTPTVTRAESAITPRVSSATNAVASGIDVANLPRTRFAELLGQRQTTQREDPAGEAADEEVLRDVVDAARRQIVDDAPTWP